MSIYWSNFIKRLYKNKRGQGKGCLSQKTSSFDYSNIIKIEYIYQKNENEEKGDGFIQLNTLQTMIQDHIQAYMQSINQTVCYYGTTCFFARITDSNEKESLLVKVDTTYKKAEKEYSIYFNTTFFIELFDKKITFFSVDDDDEKHKAKSNIDYMRSQFKRRYGLNDENVNPFIKARKNQTQGFTDNQDYFLNIQKEKVLDLYLPLWRELGRIPSTLDDIALLDMLSV